ncbi:hypothetical protein CO683_00930 [Bradyrhizobium ottawaense]|uniref:hypothetical protein n=1 Tax=Bradyrhizobium ottawaense TaxID=931866 RepID=UPI000BE8FBD7|nr:hypothetical protein [Bradyrhizobium ottawaense]PDT71755.1 hypothetical protein CO683_00930 [Bradyrhizobium ottawaense]
MTNILGQIAMLPEETTCFCSEPAPHWHAYEAVFDGEKWIPATSQAGIDIVMSLQEDGAARQAKATGAHR